MALNCMDSVLAGLLQSSVGFRLVKSHLDAMQKHSYHIVNETLTKMLHFFHPRFW